MPDRCPVCDRVKGGDELCGTPNDPEKCYRCTNEPHGDDSMIDDYYNCIDHAVDWRARALTAERRIRTLMRHDRRADGPRVRRAGRMGTRTPGGEEMMETCERCGRQKAGRSMTYPKTGVCFSDMLISVRPEWALDAVRECQRLAHDKYQNDYREIIRCLTRALTLAVGEERAALELDEWEREHPEGRR